MKSDGVFLTVVCTKVAPSIGANFLWGFGHEWMQLVALI